MKVFMRIAFCVLALVVIVGCASTEVIKRDSKIGTKKIARPDHIYVYPFAASHADIPSWSAGAERYTRPSKSFTSEELEVGRKLGVLVAKELVAEIKKMGFLTLKGNPQSLPQINDLMLTGYFEAIDEGSTVKRLVLGFGSGAPELKTSVESFQMTPNGPRLLESDELQSGGGKTPGVILPLAIFAATANPIGLVVMSTVKVAEEVTGKSKIEGTAKQTAETIADQLRVKFKKQGWIQ